MATSQARKKSTAQPKASAGPFSNVARKQPGAARRLHSQGVQTIEAVLGKGRDPVLGLYLHTVHILLIKSLGRNPRLPEHHASERSTLRRLLLRLISG